MKTLSAPVILSCLLFFSSTASSDVLFGGGGRSFNNGDWTVSGDTEIDSWMIIVPGNFTQNGVHGEATVASLGICEGIIVDTVIGGWTSSRSMAIIDSTGQMRFSMSMTGNGNEFVATALGVAVGQVPYNHGDRLRATFSAPASAIGQYQWTARIENLSQDAIAEHSEPGAYPMRFSGPITVTMDCGYGVGGSIQRVVLVGDNVVPAETMAWGAVKSLFR